MKLNSKRRIRLLQTAFWPVLAVLLFMWYRGFFKPDPYILARFAPFSTGLLWSLRFGIPLLVLYVTGLIWGFNTGRMSRANTTTLIGSLLICGVIGLSVIQYKYKKSMQSANEFHPYLQLMPAAVPEIDPVNFNIFCLGGSTTEFRDSKNTGWPERVEQLLNERLNRKDIRVYNLGRQWYTTQHTLIYYETSIRPCRPDAVIVMHTINDLLQNADFSYFSRGAFRRDYGHFDGAVYRLVRPHSFLSFLRWMVSSMWNHKPREIIDTDFFPGRTSFEQNLGSLIDLTEKDHVKTILMTQPNLYKPDLNERELNTLYMLRFEAIGPVKHWSASTVRNGFLQYRESIRSIAALRHVACIDLEPRIPKSLEYFTDDVHYTDKAFDAVAEAVADGIIKSVSLQRSDF
jgi:lysophospholipase L1-like esterase